MKNLLKIWKISPKKAKKFSLIFLFLSLLNSFLEVIALLSILPILDNFINKSGNFISYLDNFLISHLQIDPSKTFEIFLYLLILVFLIKFLINFTFIYFNQYLIKYLKAYFSKMMLESYLRENYSFYTSNNTSLLLRNINIEIPRFISGVITNTLNLISDTLLIISITTMLLFYNFYSTLSIGLIVFAFAIFYLFLTKTTIKNLGEKRHIYDGISLKNLREIFDNIKVVKVLNKETFFSERFYGYLNKSLNTHMIFNIVASSPRILLEFLVILLIIIVCLLSNSNESIIYTISIYAGSAVRLIPSTTKIINALTNIKFDTPILNILHDKIYLNKNNYPEVSNKLKNNDFKFESFNSSIRFKNVSYNYEKIPVLENINLEIKKNQIIGIIGKTGTGKSTFVDLLAGLIYPKKGQILIDDFLNLGKENSRDWQSKIGYMSQELTMIDGPLIENIAFGVPNKNIDNDRILNCVRDSQLNLTMDQIKNETTGERGIKFSGGEKQRLVLARTLYFDPEIIILDEFTNSLDAYTEEEILKTIKSLNNKTRIIITHNDKILKYCDQIFELKENNIFSIKK